MKVSILQSICELLMCDDSSSLSDQKRSDLVGWLNGEVAKFGFGDWIELYHFNPDSSDKPVFIEHDRSTGNRLVLFRGKTHWCFDSLDAENFVKSIRKADGF